MDDNVKKIIKEKFDALPKAIQEMILSTHYEETLIEIGKQYNLNVEQVGIMERETTLVMMGLTPTKDFEVELTRELHIDKLKGSQIVKDINEKIFLRIRELLKLMNTPKGEGPALEEKEKTQGGDTQILNSAGIEIISDLQAAPSAQSMQTEKLEIAPPREKSPEAPAKIPIKVGTEIKKPPAPIPAPTSIKVETEIKEENPLLAQKLSSSFQVGVEKTEHSLDNITKTTAPSAASVKVKIPNVDPYRELPE